MLERVGLTGKAMPRIAAGLNESRHSSVEPRSRVQGPFEGCNWKKCWSFVLGSKTDFGKGIVSKWRHCTCDIIAFV